MRRTSSISRRYQCNGGMSFVLMHPPRHDRAMRSAPLIPVAEATVVIRVATAADRDDLRRLAALDSARPLDGTVLVAESDGQIRAAYGVVSAGYAFTGLHAHVSGGNVVITGRIVGSRRQVPPLVRLLTYQLSGTITDASGKPVQGAVVITRTQDRDFWTHSSASDANGHYTSYFAASDETSADPVSLAVGVALGNTAYGGNVGTNVDFARLKSATMNIQLGNGTAYTVQKPSSFTGAIYSGLVVGVTAGGKVIKPISETWPSVNGSFSMTLPGSARGKVLTFWENQRQAFSHFAARAGGRIDLAAWPAQLGDVVPTGLATLKVKR